MGQFFAELTDAGNVFAHASYILLISSMLMTSLRRLRILALGSGIAAMLHFTLQTRDNASLAWEASDFLGEMSLVSGNRATASVVVTNTMRIATINREQLSQLVRQFPNIGNAFESALNRGLAAKVLRMNRAVSASLA